MNEDVSVNLEQKLIINENEIFPISSMIDCHGNKTESTDSACFAIGQMKSGDWLCVDLSKLEKNYIH